MNATIDTALTLAFKNNIDIKFQQEGSRLRMHSRQEAYQGASLFIDRMTPTTASTITGRNQDTQYNDTTFDRRMVGRKLVTSNGLIDEFDRVRMLADPTNPMVTQAVYALGRQIDTDFIAAATGTAYSGQMGTTAVTFPSGNIIAATYSDTGGSSSTNLTIDKLRKARQLMDDQEALNPIFMGSDKPIAIVMPGALHSLLTYTPVINANYNTVRALVDGQVDTFMGFDFIRLAPSFFPSAGSNLLPVICYAPMAMCVAVNPDIEARIEQLPTKNYTTQYFTRVIYGVTRLWEEGVIQINVDTTAI